MPICARRSVHPHARGDNQPALEQSLPCGGSPPRAWGQRHRARRSVRGFWFTPTRVGTTIPHRYGWLRCSVHPHARGDNAVGLTGLETRCGSPPRAWGQPTRSPPAATSNRFTPTRVGTTTTFGASPCSQAVHPHARGDNLRLWRRVRREAGSPPRAWGQRRTSPRHQPQRRFTPTRVGTTGFQRR